MFVIFSLKKLLDCKQGHKCKVNIVCLLYPAWGAVSKCQNGMPMVAREAFNMGEVWNPVCCHGNNCKARIMEHIWNLAAKNQTIWHKLVEISPSYWNKIWLSAWRHHLVYLISLRTLLSLEWKEIFESNKQHFYFSGRLIFYFKMAWIGKMRFSSEYKRSLL